MVFKLKSVSKYGTAYYSRDNFKQTVAVPSAQFADGKVPETLEVGGEGVTFAEKAPRVQATGLAKALKGAPDDVKKLARDAARKATADALTAAGISL